MTGRRHSMDSKGQQYATFVDFLLGQIASLVEVPGERDFGIDYYCQPRVPADHQTETVTELAALQVKGGAQGLSYGGVNERGEWRRHEFAWLKSLAVPLYLAKVDADCKAVELFSLWPLWLIFWKQTALPFEIVISTRRPDDGTSPWKEPEASPHPAGAGNGDGMRWEVEVGPPILRLTADELRVPTFKQNATTILRTWITLDRATVMQFHMFIPAPSGITGWRTNSIENLETRIWQVWDPRPGVNIGRLCQTAQPLLVNLGIHLQKQDDKAAYTLMPVLKWLQEIGQLGGIGKNLLEGLSQTEAMGVSPATNLDGSTDTSGAVVSVVASPSPEAGEDD